MRPQRLCAGELGVGLEWCNCVPCVLSPLIWPKVSPGASPTISRVTPDPGTPLHNHAPQKLALHTSEPALAPGHLPSLGLCSQLLHNPALTTSGWLPPHKAGPGHLSDQGPVTLTRLPTVVCKPPQKDLCCLHKQQP